MPGPTDRPSSSIGLVSRWGFFVVALVLGTALLVSSLTSYLGALTVLRTVMHGQGEGLNRSLQRHLEAAGPPGPSTPAVLLEFIEHNAQEGVRYVALFGPHGDLIVAAGESSAAEVSRILPGAMVIEGDRVRVSFPLNRKAAPSPPYPRGEGKPPPRHARPGDGKPPPRDGRPPVRDGKPPPRDGKPPPRDGKHPPPDPPLAVIEFRPEAALDLQARAQRDLGVGLTVAVALMLASLTFWRLSRRAQRAERELHDQRHLASLGEMSAVLAHELRNPLASLKGHAQLLAERVEDQPRLRRKADRIVDETQRLETLASSLLDFARTRRIQREPADPSTLLRRAADACDDATVEVDTEQAPPRWPLDALKLERVLSNLLDNAHQAAPQGTIEASARLEDQRLVYEIRDHGPGVPAEERERIFEPFHTTRTRGTGLGLAVARRIVEQHGGHLEVRDAPGGGACFRLELPAR